MTVVDRIHQKVAAQRLLDHPFYQAWSRGALTRGMLQTYATQYYHWVHAFPTWLSATHANAADLEMRQEILSNLVDEEQGADNHPELWLRFCEALGLDRADVTHAELLPETREALAAMRRVSRDEAAVASLAALYAYESQQPEVMKTKADGLRGLYGMTTGCEYLDVHQALDVEHSAAERSMIERHADGADDAIDRATAVALDATYTILTGIQRAAMADRA